MLYLVEFFWECFDWKNTDYQWFVLWIPLLLLFILSYYLMLYTLNSEGASIKTFRAAKKWLELHDYDFHAFIWSVLTCQTKCFMDQYERMHKAMYYVFFTCYYVCCLAELVFWIITLIWYERWAYLLYPIFVLRIFLAFVLFRFVRVLWMIVWTIITWPIWCCCYCCDWCFHWNSKK